MADDENRNGIQLPSTSNQNQAENSSSKQGLSSSTQNIQRRAKNRLKEATSKLRVALKAALAPVKKYIMLGVITLIVIVAVMTLLSVSLMYIWDKLQVQDTEDKSNVPGVTKNVMTATAQKDPKTGEMSFVYNKKDPKTNKATNLNNSFTTTSLDNFLFIGDSRYAGIDDINNLGNNIKNAGVGSSTIDEWVKVVKNKGKGTVQKQSIDITGTYSGISIQLGANGVYQNVDNTVNSMKTLITEVQKLYPNVPIYVNSCVQVNSKANNSGYNWDATIFKDNVNDFNKKVQAYCNSVNNVFYIDVNVNLNDSNGFLKNEYTNDGLHCNEQGGQIFANNIKNAILNSSSTAGNTANNAKDSDFLIMTESIVISKNDKGEYCIARDLDARVNEIYKVLKENESGGLKFFNTEKEMKEALKLWIMAEYSSQYVNLSENVEKYKYDYNADYIQGSVKVKRYSVDDNGKEVGKFITYKTPDEFNKLKLNYQNSGDTTVFNHFTIDQEDNLVIAKYIREDQTSSWTGETDPNGKLDPEYTKYNISEQKLNYRSMTREYMIPFNLLWSMVVYGKDVSFSNEIAKLAIDSQMVIGIRDNVTTTVTTTVDKYLNEEKLHEYIDLTVEAPGSIQKTKVNNFFEYYIRPSGTKTTSETSEKDYSANSENTGLSGINESMFFEKTTINTLRSDSVYMEVEYIDGWFAKYEMKYEAVRTPGTDNSNTVPIANTEYELIGTEKKETSNSDEADSIISGDTYAPEMYDNLKEEIKSTAGTDILRNAIYGQIQTSLSAHGSPYYPIVWNYGQVVDDIINGVGNSYRDLTQERVDSITSGYKVKEVREGCASIYNSLLGFYNSAKKDEILNNNIRASYALIKKENFRRTVNRTVTTTVNIDTKKFNKTETKTTEKTSKKVKNGETENFVSILCKREHIKAYNGLTGSISNWFFKAIAKNEDTEVFIDLLKYLFYKATGESYGVTEYDMSTVKFKLNQSNMSNIGILAGDTVEAKVWFGMKKAGFSDMQVAAAMGNYAHESGYKTNNLENRVEYTYGNDETFTEKVNNGSIDRNTFINQSIDGSIWGYGLVQWSAASRKEGLYDYAKSKGVSIDDANMQVEYLLGEFGYGPAYEQGYAKIALSPESNTTYAGNYSASDWYNATSDELDENLLRKITLSFCYTFERPAQSTESENSRVASALKYYNKFHGKTLMGASGGVYQTKATADDGIFGYFQSGNGRIFTVYNQCSIPGYDWSEYCNKAAAASILSAYRKSGQSDMDVAYAMNDPHAPLADISDTKSIFKEYGLNALYVGGFDRNKMELTLKSGGYVAIHVKGYGTTRTGTKSGFKYTNGNSMHWVAILGYRVENGEEQIMISNSGWYDTSGWVPIDDFAAFDSNIDMSWYITE